MLARYVRDLIPRCPPPSSVPPLFRKHLGGRLHSAPGEGCVSMCARTRLELFGIWLFRFFSQRNRDFSPGHDRIMKGTEVGSLPCCPSLSLTKRNDQEGGNSAMSDIESQWKGSFSLSGKRNPAGYLTQRWPGHVFGFMVGGARPPSPNCCHRGTWIGMKQSSSHIWNPKPKTTFGGPRQTTMGPLPLR